MTEPRHERWEREAGAWARWVRTPGHDAWHWRLSWPAFLHLLPAPGRLTLDLGCGEGRGGVALCEQGHRVVGVDAAPTMAGLARETGVYEEVRRADAAALPLADGSVDHVVAYMSLHDIDDLAGTLRETARVLGPGGRLCAAIVHPFASAHVGSDARRPYFEVGHYTEVHERDGIEMAFHGIHRPLGDYIGALLAAGLVLEALREPAPSDEDIAALPELAKARRGPAFLHWRASRR